MEFLSFIRQVQGKLKQVSSYLSKAITYCALTVIGLFITTNGAVAADTATMDAQDTWGDANDGSVGGDVVDAGDHVSGNTQNLVINTLSDDIAIGDITMTGGEVDIINTNGGGAMTMSIGSITSTTGNLDIDMINQEDDMTITVTGAIDIGGTLVFTNADADGNKAGILSVAGNTTVDGATTLVAADDGATTMKVGGSSVTFTGKVTLNDDTGLAILFVNGTAAQTVTFTADIVGASAAEGTIDVANTSAPVTFASAIGNTAGKNLLEIEVSANTEAIFKKTIDTVTFDIDNDVTLYENANVVGTDGGNAGALNVAASSIITLNDTIVAGETVFTGTTAAASTSGLILAASTYKMPANFTSGTITFWDGDAGASTADVANMTVTDTALTDYSANVVDTTDVSLTVSKKSDSTAATELGVNVDVANAFEQARDSAISDTNTDAALEDAFTNVLNAGNTEDSHLAQQVSPQTDGFQGAAHSVNKVNSSVMGIASTRLASLRNGDAFATSGFAAGSGSLNSSIFIRPFGHAAQGDGHDGVQGFDSITKGFSAGFDTVTRNGAIVGLSYSTSKTKIDGDGAGNVNHDFDTQQLTLYGDYSTDKYYLEGMLGVAYNQNDTERYVDGGGIVRTITGKYDSYQASARIAAGKPFKTSEAGYFTPIISLSTSLLDSDQYTETGGTNLNLKIKADDFTSAITSLGLRWHGVIDHKAGGTSIPELRIGAGYDVAGDTVSTTASYTGGGSEFTVAGTDDRAHASLGLGYALAFGGVSLGLNADVEAKEHGANGTASAELKVKF